MTNSTGGQTVTEPTYYELLGVEPEAPEAEIHRAYRAAIKLCHPDLARTGAEREEYGRHAALLNSARDTLLDPIARARYDRILNEQTAGAETARDEQEGGASQQAGERDDAFWERVRQEAEWGAEEAWRRWENPPLGRRLGTALGGFMRSGARSTLYLATMLTYPMACLTVGGALMLAFGRWYVFIPLWLQALAMASVLACAPVEIIARNLFWHSRYRVGDPRSWPERPTRGQKAAFVISLSAGAVWKGTLSFLVLGFLFAVLDTLVLSEATGEVLALGVLIAPAWCLVFLTTLLVRAALSAINSMRR